MTSTTSLLACSAADVTFNRVSELVAQGQPESFTLEYKEKFSASLVKSVAAMANTYGGLILVGVTDKKVENRIVGVSEDVITSIVNGCFESLEPPTWQPEIISLPLPHDPDRVVVVIRVHVDGVPRPILISGAAPIRLLGRNATADRGRLKELFQEAPIGGRGMAPLPAPSLDNLGPNREPALFILRSGLRLSVGSTATWRALSERGVFVVADALENSLFTRGVRAWCTELNSYPVSPPRRAGHNRARTLRLVQTTEKGNPVEVVSELQLPSVYGMPGSDMLFTLDLVAGKGLRNKTISGALMSSHTGDAVEPWRLSVMRMRALLDAMLASLVDDALIVALAGLGGIEPITVPQPSSLMFRSSLDVQDLLESHGLTPIPGAGTSRGADLVADPALDLRNPSERSEQVNEWIEQISLDAGLSGMERQLQQPPLPPSMR